MKYVRVITLMTLPLVLSACGYIKIKDTSDNYKQAKVAPAIVYPDALTRPDAEALYDIPNVLVQSGVSVEDQPKFSSVIAPPKVAVGSEKIVSLRSLGENYWISAQFRTSSMWTALQGFAGTQTFKVERLDPITGILESKWQASKDQSGFSKLLFKVNSGVQSGTSELNVIAIRSSSNANPVDWQKGSTDKEYELEILKRAAKYLDSRNIPPAVSVGVEHESLKIESNEDGKYLKLGLSPSRAWASTLQAAERAGYTVEAENTGTGKITISKVLSAEEMKKGLFSKWKKAEESSSDFTLQLHLQPVDRFTTAVFVTADKKPKEKQVLEILHELMPYFN